MVRDWAVDIVRHRLSRSGTAGPFTAAGALAIDSSDAAFAIASTTPSITVTAPNTAVTLAVGTIQAISWNHNLGIQSFVRIDVSRDAGASWETIAPSVQNAGATSGTFQWSVIGPTTTSALVRVTWIDGPATDSSNVLFSIVSPGVTVAAPNATVNWVIGSTHNITWGHNLGRHETVNLDLSRDGGVTWAAIASSVPNTANTSGTFSWVVTGPVTTTARIRVAWIKDGTVQDVSDVSFTIASRITVANPSGLPWGAGSARTVTWTHNYGASQAFDLDFSPDKGVTWVPIAKAVPTATATTGSYTGPMPTTPTTQGLVRVGPADLPGDGDTNNSPFAVVAASLSVTAPNTGVNWVIGSAHNITWSHNLGTAETVNLEVSRDGGATWATVASNAANTANTSGTFSWVVTGPVTTTARIRVTWTRDGTAQDVSDVNFGIH